MTSSAVTMECRRLSRGSWSDWMVVRPSNVWTRGVWWQLNVNPAQAIAANSPGAPPVIQPSTVEYRAARICPDCCVSAGQPHDDWCPWNIDFAEPAESTTTNEGASA